MMLAPSRHVLLLTALASLLPTSLVFCQDLPPVRVATVRVNSVRRLFHNGQHNAFTDLCRFGDHIYLTFRTCPDGHMVHPTSSILVLRTTDGTDWQQVHQFNVPLRDTRDPHFLVFQQKLFVITGTWYCGATSPKSRDLNEHLGYACVTSDGTNWQGPHLLEGTYGHYVWRAAAHGNRAYLCGRRKHEFYKSDEPEPDIVESALLASDDGLVWSKVGLFQEKFGDETAFLFEPDGSILAVARGGGKQPAQLCRAQHPYRDWQRTDLGRQVGGPLLTRWNGHTLVGGRKTLADPKTTLYWLSDDQLREFAELPSAGDNSYPGFVALDDRRAWISYYSTHERNDAGQPITAIYLAELAWDR
jgi:hypothetical protein